MKELKSIPFATLTEPELEEAERSVEALSDTLGIAVRSMRNRRRVLNDEEKLRALDRQRREQPALLHRLLTEPGLDAVVTLHLPEDKANYTIPANRVMAPFPGEDCSIKSTAFQVKTTWKAFASPFDRMRDLSVLGDRSFLYECARLCDAGATTIQRIGRREIEWTTLTYMGIDNSDLRDICLAFPKCLLGPGERQYGEYDHFYHNESDTEYDDSMESPDIWAGSRLLTRVWFLTEAGARMKAISPRRMAWWSAIIRAQAARAGSTTHKRRRTREARVDS